METREQTEAREKKLVDDTKKFAQSGLSKLGINITNPLAGLDSLPTTEESLDPDSLKIHQDSNKPIEQVTFDIRSLDQLNEISKILDKNGDTLIKIRIHDDKNDLSFQLKNKRNLDRKTLNLLRNKEISAIIR